MRFNSMILKLIGIVVVTTTLVLTTFGFYEYRKNLQTLSSQLAASLVLTQKRLALNLRRPLLNYDDKAIHNIIVSEMDNKNIVGVFLAESGIEEPSYGRVRADNDIITSSTSLLAPQGNVVGA